MQQVDRASRWTGPPWLYKWTCFSVTELLSKGDSALICKWGGSWPSWQLLSVVTCTLVMHNSSPIHNFYTGQIGPSCFHSYRPTSIRKCQINAPVSCTRYFSSLFEPRYLDIWWLFYPLKLSFLERLFSVWHILHPLLAVQLIWMSAKKCLAD